MILVTGGAGYIGSHTVKALRARGEDVAVLDSLEKGHEAALLGARLLRADLRDSEATLRALVAEQVEAVIHFAAYTEVGESVTRPADYYRNNVVGSLNLLEACRKAGVGQIVFSSTAAVYGEPEATPISEDHPTPPTNPYGETKLAVERALAAYEVAYGLRSVRLRYFNAAGTDPDGELGEDHRPETHLVPRALLAVLGRCEFQVFGDDFDTPDGTCVRDYVHVTDLATAHLAALDHLRSGGAGGAYNLGNARGHSVREVVEAVRRVTGAAFNPPVGPRRVGDPAQLVASSDRARQALGWRPRYPELESMVEHAWRWFVRCPEGYGA